MVCFADSFVGIKNIFCKTKIISIFVLTKLVYHVSSRSKSQIFTQTPWMDTRGICEQTEYQTLLNWVLRGLPNADTRKNLDAIIAASRAASARVVVVGIQIPPNYGLEYAQQFRDMYPDLAAKYKLPLVPFLLEGIADKLEFFQADRLHPTAAAQPRIVENVLPAVWQAVSKTSAAARK